MTHIPPATKVLAYKGGDLSEDLVVCHALVCTEVRCHVGAHYMTSAAVLYAATSVVGTTHIR